MIFQRKPHMGIVISDHNYHALLQIADEMLLLSDRYVYLVRERSDLVRYGYYHINRYEFKTKIART